MNINDLKDYLHKVRTLKETCYTCRTSMGKLQTEADGLGHKRDIIKPTRYWWGLTWESDDFLVLSGWITILMVILAFIFYFWKWPNAFGRLVFLRILCAGVFALVVGSLVALAITGIIYVGNFIYGFFYWGNTYRENMAKYHLEVGEDAERIKYELVVQKNLMAERDALNETLISARKLLNKLYSYNIIYPKYRDMVAVTMFCEYLDSGRCNRLEGSDGAYNKFDQQVAAGLIIAELKNISSQLEAIRQTQYMLYEEMKRGNSKADRILKSAMAMEHNSEAAKYNSEMAAQNAGIAAWEITMQNIWMGFSKR